MPLNRPALSLGAGPRGVQDARRWVVEVIREMGRPELVECAEMAVSELVTNALLHAAPPIQVRVRGTHEHPRVEVADGSTEPPDVSGSGDPDLDGDDPDLDDLLLTFGRGLSIVARASEAWGAEVEDDGKTVWFVPAAEFSEDDGAEGQITGVGLGGQATGEQPTDLTEFRLRAMPIRSYVTFQNHFRELRREVRLLALAHESDYPLAGELADVFDRLGRPMTLGIGSQQVRDAQERGETVIDLRVVMSRAAAAGGDRFVELLELTDAFCRAERMLSLARSPQQVAFQQWFIGQFVAQANGAEATAWQPSAGTGETRRRSNAC